MFFGELRWMRGLGGWLTGSVAGWMVTGWNRWICYGESVWCCCHDGLLAGYQRCVDDDVYRVGGEGLSMAASNDV